jgi:hypothetical protein
MSNVIKGAENAGVVHIQIRDDAFRRNRWRPRLLVRPEETLFRGDSREKQGLTAPATSAA